MWNSAVGKSAVAKRKKKITIDPGYLHHRILAIVVYGAVPLLKFKTAETYAQSVITKTISDLTDFNV
jgi:hypothetical protein